MAEVEVNVLLETLNVSTGETNNARIIELLEGVSRASQSEGVFETADVSAPFKALLQRIDLNIDARTQLYRTTAELTKIDGQRQRFTDETILRSLLTWLYDETKQEGAFSLRTQRYTDLEFLAAIQLCRAIGNICYNNEAARDIILNFHGDVSIVNLLDIKVDVTSELQLQFAKFRGGLLTNYLLGGEHLAKCAVDLNILVPIEQVITDCIGNREQQPNAAVLINVLQPLSLLTDNITDLNFPTGLVAKLADLLTLSKDPDVAEICLEMLNYQAENDDVKFQLANDGLCEQLFKLVETYKTLADTIDARALMKLACDLIVLVLTGDESMKSLYQTPLLNNMICWLDSDDIDLLTTGVLALGNFARTDTHCIEMVRKNITAKLLDILSKNNGVDDEMKLQHALLSALRNLVIPKENKAVIIKAGLVETILPMLQIHQSPVVYKLLGTLRMLIDGQPQLALKQLENAVLIKQLIEWCKSSDCSSVTGESYRLMAWLVKHAYKETAQNPRSSTETNTSSLRKFCSIDGAVNCMVMMLSSQHLVMQNEALMALCIMSSIFVQNPSNDLNLIGILIDCDLGGNLANFMQRNADTMTKEIVENVQTLIALLRHSEALVNHLKNHNIDALLKTIPILIEYCTL